MKSVRKAIADGCKGIRFGISYQVEDQETEEQKKIKKIQNLKNEICKRKNQKQKGKIYFFLTTILAPIATQGRLTLRSVWTSRITRNAPGGLLLQSVPSTVC